MAVVATVEITPNQRAVEARKDKRQLMVSRGWERPARWPEGSSSLRNKLLFLLFAFTSPQFSLSFPFVFALSRSSHYVKYSCIQSCVKRKSGSFLSPPGVCSISCLYVYRLVHLPLTWSPPGRGGGQVGVGQDSVP